MPARVIRGEINASDSLARVSMPADLTFRALIVAADDWGRLDGRLPVLRGMLFPLRQEVTDRKLDGWLDELAAGPDAPIVRYVVDGRPFIALMGWEKHRGKAKRAPCGDLTVAAGEIDTWLAQDLSAAKLATKPFSPLPVLGVPGWWAANADPAFYDDAEVFRPRRVKALGQKPYANPEITPAV